MILTGLLLFIVVYVLFSLVNNSIRTTTKGVEGLTRALKSDKVKRAIAWANEVKHRKL